MYKDELNSLYFRFLPVNYYSKNIDYRKESVQYKTFYGFNLKKILN